MTNYRSLKQFLVNSRNRDLIRHYLSTVLQQSFFHVCDTFYCKHITSSAPISFLLHAVNCVRFCFLALWLITARKSGSVFRVVCEFFIFFDFFLWNSWTDLRQIHKRTCLITRSDDFACQGQRSRSPGTKNALSSPVTHRQHTNAMRSMQTAADGTIASLRGVI